MGREGSYRNEVYRSILDTVRPRGIRAFVEFVEKTDLGIGEREPIRCGGRKTDG